jgi:hypothetical protein
VTATFTEDEYTLTIHTIGSGSVDEDPELTTYRYGDVVTLTANATVGWTFDHWSGAATGSINPVTVTMDGDESVTAYFTQDQYALTINTDGSGTVDKDPNQATYSYGDVVTLTANANTNWDFAEWSGDAIGTDNPITMTMDGNKTVTATFEYVAPSVSVRFSSAIYNAKETDGVATITVVLDGTSAVPVTVAYATSNGTATAGSDYAATSDTLHFAVGQTSRTFTVPVFGDATAEGDETVNLMLSAPVNAVLGTPHQATLTIENNAIYLPLALRNHH